MLNFATIWHVLGVRPEPVHGLLHWLSKQTPAAFQRLVA
jgi:hypothetical protein